MAYFNTLSKRSAIPEITKFILKRLPCQPNHSVKVPMGQI